MIEREYEPSKNHPYDVHPTPVYKKDNNGNFILCKGNKNHSENNRFHFGYIYNTQINKPNFQKNRNDFLNEIELLHLLRTFKDSKLSVYAFQNYEDQFVSNIGESKYHTVSSMNMLDQHQYQLQNNERYSSKKTKTNLGHSKKMYFKIILASLMTVPARKNGTTTIFIHVQIQHLME